MRRSKEDWKSLILEQGVSGQGVSAFCRERGLASSSFKYWRDKLEQGKEKFVRVDFGERIELELSNGSCIRVGRSDLKVVLEALCGR